MCYDEACHLHIGSNSLLPFYVWAVQRQHSQAKLNVRAAAAFQNIWKSILKWNIITQKGWQQSFLTYKCRISRAWYFAERTRSIIDFIEHPKVVDRGRHVGKKMKKRPNNGGTYKIKGGCQCWQRKLRVVLWICLREEIRYVIFTYFTLPVASNRRRLQLCSPTSFSTGLKCREIMARGQNGGFVGVRHIQQLFADWNGNHCSKAASELPSLAPAVVWIAENSAKCCSFRLQVRPQLE